MTLSDETPGPAESTGAVLRNIPPRHDNASDPSDVDPREALELQNIQTREDNELDDSAGSASSGDEYRVVTRRTTSRALDARADARRRKQARTGAWGKLTRFWTHHVTLTVPHKSNRDYFGGFQRDVVLPFTPMLITSKLWRGRSSRTYAHRLLSHNKAFSSHNFFVYRQRKRWQTSWDFIRSASHFQWRVTVWLSLWL